MLLGSQTQLSALNNFSQVEKSFMQSSMLLCGWLPVVSLFFAYLLQTQRICYCKGLTSILLKELCGICMMTREQMCSPTPQPSGAGMLFKISCHVPFLPTPLFMFANEFWHPGSSESGKTSLLLEFPPAYQSFCITRRKFFTVKFLVLLQTKQKEVGSHSFQQVP